MSLMDEINNQLNANAQKEREVREKEEMERSLDPMGIMDTFYDSETFRNHAFVNTETPDGIGDLIKEALGIIDKTRFASDIKYSREDIKEADSAATYIWCCHFQTEENGRRCMVEDFRHYSVFYRHFRNSLFNPIRRQAVNYLDSYLKKYSSYLLDSKNSNRFVSGGGLYLFEDGFCYDSANDYYGGCIYELTSHYGNKKNQFDIFKTNLAALVIANTQKFV